MRWWLLGVSLALQVACYGKIGDDDNDNNEQDDDDDGGGGLAPVNGYWSSVMQSITSDTCGFGLVAGEEGPGFTVTGSSAVGFTMTLDGVDPVTCTLTGSGFDCPTASTTFDVSDTTTLLLTYDLQGSMLSSTSMSGDLSVGYECEGPDCGSLADKSEITFPCAAAGTFQATGFSGTTEPTDTSDTSAPD